MLGVVTDQEGGYVKAAVIKMFKEQDEDSELQAVTYAMTDENGRFAVQNLDPDEKYVIEVYLENPMAVTKNELTADIQEMDEHDDFSESEANDSNAEAFDDKAEAEDYKGSRNVKVKINYEAKAVAKSEFAPITIDGAEADDLNGHEEISRGNDFPEDIQTDGFIISNLNQNQTGRQFTRSAKSNQELETRLYSVKACTWM